MGCGGIEKVQTSEHIKIQESIIIAVKQDDIQPNTITQVQIQDSVTLNQPIIDTHEDKEEKQVTEASDSEADIQQEPTKQIVPELKKLTRVNTYPMNPDQTPNILEQSASDVALDYKNHALGIGLQVNSTEQSEVNSGRGSLSKQISQDKDTDDVENQHNKTNADSNNQKPVNDSRWRVVINSENQESVVKSQTRIALYQQNENDSLELFSQARTTLEGQVGQIETVIIENQSHLHDNMDGFTNKVGGLITRRDSEVRAEIHFTRKDSNAD